MYVGIGTLITLHILSNLLAQNGHQGCHRLHYMQNWSCD